MKNNQSNFFFWDKIKENNYTCFDTLSYSISADIAIIGGGILGLSVAIGAGESGLKVILLEKNQIGNGASGINSGFIVPKLRPLPSKKTLFQTLGKDNSETFMELVNSSGDKLISEIKKNNIQCQLNTNGWISAAHSIHISELQKLEYAKEVSERTDIKLLNKNELEMITGLNHWHGGILYKSGGSLNPKAYCEGLSKVAANLGVKIFENSGVKKIVEKNGHIYLTVNNYEVNAKKIVLATNALSGSLFPLDSQTFMKINIFQGVTRQLPEELKQYVLPANTVLTDTSPIQIAIRWTPDNRILTGGILRLGLGSKQALAKHIFGKRLKNILSPVIKQFNFSPNLLDIEYVWSGSVALTKTGLPQIFKISDLASSIISCNGRGVALGSSIGKIYGGYLTQNLSKNYANLIESISCPPAKYFAANLIKLGAPVWALWNEIRQKF